MLKGTDENTLFKSFQQEQTDFRKASKMQQNGGTFSVIVD